MHHASNEVEATEHDLPLLLDAFYHLLTMSDLRRALALYCSGQYAAALPLLHAALCRSEQILGGSTSAETAEILLLL